MKILPMVAEIEMLLFKKFLLIIGRADAEWHLLLFAGDISNLISANNLNDFQTKSTSILICVSE
jgi:hypothetical protein